MCKYNIVLNFNILKCLIYQVIYSHIGNAYDKLSQTENAIFYILNNNM